MNKKGFFGYGRCPHCETFLKEKDLEKNICWKCNGRIDNKISQSKITDNQIVISQKQIELGMTHLTVGIKKNKLIEEFRKIVNANFIDDQIQYVINKYGINNTIEMVKKNAESRSMVFDETNLLYDSGFHYINKTRSNPALSPLFFQAHLFHSVYFRTISYLRHKYPKEYKYLKMKNNVLSMEETKDRMDKSYDHVLLFVCLSKSNLPPPHYAGFDVSENEFKELYLNDNIINDAKNVVLERFEINYSRYWCLFHSINKAGGINKYGWFAY